MPYGVGIPSPQPGSESVGDIFGAPPARVRADTSSIMREAEDQAAAANSYGPAPQGQVYSDPVNDAGAGAIYGPPPRVELSEDVTPVGDAAQGRFLTTAALFGEAERPQVKTTTGAAKPPGERRDVEQERALEGKEIDSLIDELSSSLSPKEKKASHDVDSDEIDSLISQFDLQESAGGVADAIVAEGKKSAQFDENDTEGAGFGARFRAGLGRNQEEEVRAFKSAYGDDNVTVKGDAIYFRKAASEKFRRVDPKQFEFFKDVFADLSGTILEGVVTGGMEAAGIATSLAGAGATATGVGAPVGAAALAGGAAIMATAGAGGAAAREAAVGLTDLFADKPMRSPDISVSSELLWGAGLNLAAGGMGQAFKPVAKFGSDKFRLLMENRQMGRIEKLAQVRNWLDDFSTKMGKTGDGIGAAGRRVDNVVTEFGDELGKAVEMVESRAVALAGPDAKVQVPNMLRKMEDILRDEFVEFGADGFAVVPKTLRSVERGGADAAEIVRRAAGGADGIVTDKAAADTVDELAKGVAPFGSKNGGGTLREIIDDYNVLRMAESKGGLPMQRAFDVVRKYQDMAVFGKTKEGIYGKAELSAFAQIQNAGISDRHAVLDPLFKGSGLDEEKIYRAAFENYHQNIDEVMKIRQMFSSRDSAAQVAEALFQRENPERLQAVKKLLGPDSREWKALKGEWVAKLIDSHVDPNSGIFLGQEMRKTLHGYGKEMLGEVFTGRELKHLNKMSLTAQKIPYRDLLIEKAARRDMEDIAVMAAADAVFPATRIRFIYRIFGKNKNAADYLLNQGFLNAAKRAGNQKERSAILNTMSQAKQFFDQCRVVKVKRTDPQTGKTVMVEQYVPVGKQAFTQSAHELQRAVAAPAATMPRQAQAVGEEDDIDLDYVLDGASK